LSKWPKNFSLQTMWHLSQGVCVIIKTKVLVKYINNIVETGQVQGLVLSKKSEFLKIFWQIQKIWYSQIFPGNQKIFLTSFLVLLAGKISADFSSEFLIGIQFEKPVEFSEVWKFCQNSEDFSGFLIIKTKPWFYQQDYPEKFSEFLSDFQIAKIANQIEFMWKSFKRHF
jgi:hypothetical protein